MWNTFIRPILQQHRPAVDQFLQDAHTKVVNDWHRWGWCRRKIFATHHGGSLAFTVATGISGCKGHWWPCGSKRERFNNKRVLRQTRQTKGTAA